MPLFTMAIILTETVILYTVPHIILEDTHWYFKINATYEAFDAIARIIFAFACNYWLYFGKLGITYRIELYKWGILSLTVLQAVLYYLLRPEHASEIVDFELAADWLTGLILLWKGTLIQFIAVRTVKAIDGEIRRKEEKGVQKALLVDMSQRVQVRLSENGQLIRVDNNEPFAI